MHSSNQFLVSCFNHSDPNSDTNEISRIKTSLASAEPDYSFKALHCERKIICLILGQLEKYLQRSKRE